MQWIWSFKFPPGTPPSQRVASILGREEDEDDEDRQTHEIFCEMDELKPVGEGGEMEWRETARWKYLNLLVKHLSSNSSKLEAFFIIIIDHSCHPRHYHHDNGYVDGMFGNFYKRMLWMKLRFLIGAVGNLWQLFFGKYRLVTLSISWTEVIIFEVDCSSFCLIKMVLLISYRN